MKRSLMSQMRHEWRDNIWLVFGLTLVCLAIWFFGSALFLTLRDYFRPLGFEGDNVYVLDIGFHREGSPNYVEVEHPQEMNNADLKAILAGLRNNPNVEAAGFTQNGSPYQVSFWGNNVRLRYPTPDSIFYMGNMRYISPEIVRVLKLKSHTGKDEDYIERKLEEGEMLVSHVDKEKMPDKDYEMRLAEEIVGQTVCGWDTTKIHRVADVIVKVRRNAYEDMKDSGDLVFPIDESGDVTGSMDIMVRVKPGCGPKFRQDFEEKPEMSSQRNVYLRSCTALSDMRKSSERKQDMEVRLYTVVIGFMLVIIFLGLLGTFWFRMQQRVGEIAIRRVCGASRSDIFRRVIIEGLVLLVGASVLVSIIGWIGIVKLGYDEKFTRIDLLWLEVGTFVVVALGIVVSVAGPAWMAMRINPAEAVKDE
ncbi:MAG: hypothetical protein K2J78_13330 [Muribaculaceae bacterium]|nr:hypothetical protein [Muribaculaceae bacterium]